MRPSTNSARGYLGSPASSLRICSIALDRPVLRTRFICQRQVVLRLQQARLQLDRRLQFANRFGNVGCGQHRAEILVRIGVVRPEFDGLAKCRDRLLVFARLHVHQAEAVARLGIVGPQPDGFLETRQLLRMAFAPAAPNSRPSTR